MSKLIYGSVEVNLEGTSAPNALAVLKTMYPELANATLSENPSGDFIATVATATKGAGICAIYGDTKIELHDGVTIDVVKATLQSIYPELANATTSIDAAGNIIFRVATATKGR